MAFRIFEHLLPVLVAVSSLGASASAAGQTAELRQPAASRSKVPTVQAERIGDRPLIYPGMKGLSKKDGENINGPSLIRVPDWVRSPLGKYYLYFAHHGGDYIRLAYADSLTGPWKIHEGGVLHIKNTAAFAHIASPDVIVDDAARKIVLYFHGEDEDRAQVQGRPTTQATYYAESADGLSFRAAPEAFAQPYARAFTYKGNTYLLAMSYKKTAFPVFLRSQQFYRSATGRPPFEAGPRILEESRHVGTVVVGDVLHVFYTNVGDAPERIWHTKVDLRPDWTEWTAGPATEVLRPKTQAEGGHLPVVQSASGSVKAPVNALRDPGVFQDTDGSTYLLYSVAGENGIAIARLTFD